MPGFPDSHQIPRSAPAYISTLHTLPRHSHTHPHTLKSLTYFLAHPCAHSGPFAPTPQGKAWKWLTGSSNGSCCRTRSREDEDADVDAEDAVPDSSQPGRGGQGAGAARPRLWLPWRLLLEEEPQQSGHPPTSDLALAPHPPRHAPDTFIHLALTCLMHTSHISHMPHILHTCLIHTCHTSYSLTYPDSPQTLTTQIHTSPTRSHHFTKWGRPPDQLSPCSSIWESLSLHQTW